MAGQMTTIVYLDPQPAKTANGQRPAGDAPETAPGGSESRLPARAHLLAILGYAVLTLVMTYPIALNLVSQVPGGGDAWQHIWNLWWVKHALLDLHTSPYHTNLVYYPAGANLYFHTLVLTAGLQGIVLQWLGLNLVATYNLVLLITFVLGGYGAFLLCYYLARNAWAAFVGGLVFTFAPYHFAHLYGHMNLASVQWMPFYVLVLLKALDAPGPTTTDSKAPNGRVRGLLLAVGAGALLALNAYTDWLYAIFLALLTGLVVVWRILAPTERRVLVRQPGPVDFGLRLAVVGVAFLLLTSPIFFPTLEEARQGYAQQPPIETLVYSSDAILAFTPNELHPVWGNAVAGRIGALGPYLPIKNPSERVVFLGYAVLALSIFGAWKLRRDRQVRLWAFVAFTTWLLSLGPLLQFLGRTQFTAFGVTVPLPYLLLYKLPLFSIMRTPARLTVLTMLALAVLVAITLASLLPGLSVRRPFARPRTALVAVVFPVLVLFEFLSAPFAMVPPGWGVPIYGRIAQEPGDFALLELPLRPFGDYMAYQTVHGKPIIGGYLSRQPPDLTVQNTPALRYLLDSTAVNDPLRVEVEGGKGVRQLRELGVKYAIVRWWAFTPEARAAIREKLGVLFARPPDLSYPADQVDAWELK